jgi:hypothetical protein
MKRIHALEWEDLAWFPAAWRDYGTDYLRFIALKFDIYKNIRPVIEQGIAAGDKTSWVDCASGGGGALLNLAKALHETNPNARITLTDYYPNKAAFERTVRLGGSAFSYTTEPVDARQLPEQFAGKFRTLFGAFHHFRPADAKMILQNAVNSRSPIAIFEPVGRNAASWFSMLFVPLNVLLLTPFIRPVRWHVLPFIYLLPLIPLYILWDGVASILRTYSAKELRTLVASLQNTERFTWEIGVKKQGPSGITYLLGLPK